MRYGTLCSGIETAALAFPAHWEQQWCAEIDPFCRELLALYYPKVTNHGDITQADDRQFTNVSLVVSGTPCQAFSQQGKRGGLADPRGQLALAFCRILGRVRPRWLIWENVPHVLQLDGGRHFAAFLRGLWECGYGTAYRVLDAQYFGVPQRRRRVFVVGHHGDWRKPAAALFDRAASAEPLAAAAKVQEGRERVLQRTGRVLGWSGDETPKFGVGISPTLRAQQGGEGNGFIAGNVVRKFTLLEMERLQGIRDGYTQIGRGDGKRKQAIGNAFCVPVLRWIAARIDRLDAGGPA